MSAYRLAQISGVAQEVIRLTERKGGWGMRVDLHRAIITALGISHNAFWKLLPPLDLTQPKANMPHVRKHSVPRKVARTATIPIMELD